MKHCDFFGRELVVGDRVAYIDSKYQELRNGEILLPLAVRRSRCLRSSFLLSELH